MKNPKIALIGLGYVGLPLAAAFASKYHVIGFDINTKRVDELNNGFDATNELSNEQLKAVVGTSLKLTTTVADIAQCNTFIVTVPTPVTSSKSPDLTPVVKATESVAMVLKKGDTVVYESTVYPGVTEDICVPILEEKTGLKFNRDFFVGYSPERINPGDKKHTITKITKVVSGSTPETLKELTALYGSIIEAGIYEAPTIKTAEAAKVIENTQRDLNIALINELALIFNKLGIDTEAVLKAAGTKWNFLPFKPGLVGGHCIGVDPYYLTQKANEVNYYPEIVLAGRRLNDNMGTYVADQVSKLMYKNKIHVGNSNVLIMGFAFKENCTDHRNTRVVDLFNQFKSFNCNIDIYDPWIDKDHAYEEYNIKLIDEPKNNYYDAIVIAVAHDKFKGLSEKQIRAYGKDKHILYDIKYLLKASESDGRL